MRKSILLLALFSMVIVSTSCSKPEEATISKYFEAMKLNDKDTLSAMSTEPKDIEYSAFEIVSIGEPEVQPLQLPNYKTELADLEKKMKDQKKVAMEKKFEIDDLNDELEDTRRRAKKVELENKIKEAEAQLEVEGNKIKEIRQATTDAKKKIAREKSLIKTSTTVEKNLEAWTGESHTSKAVVKITLEGGGVEDFVFLLKKFHLKLKDRPRKGRWVIIKIATVSDFEKEQQKMQEEANTETQNVTEEKTTEETSTTN